MAFFINFLMISDSDIRYLISDIRSVCLDNIRYLIPEQKIVIRRPIGDGDQHAHSNCYADVDTNADADDKIDIDADVEVDDNDNKDANDDEDDDKR